MHSLRCCCILYIQTKTKGIMNYSYEIKDSEIYGTKVFLHLPEGDFHGNLTYRKGMDGEREWLVNGNFPKKYSVTYNGCKLNVLELKDDKFTVGQVVNHKRHGKGTVTFVNDKNGSMQVEFESGETKNLIIELVGNFLN